MIGTFLNAVRSLLNNEISSRLGLIEEPIIQGNISQLDSLSNLTGSVLMSLVNLEQDAPLRNNPNYTSLSDTQIKYHNPKTVINLYILFATHLTEDTGTTGLDILTEVIASLQRRNVFTGQELGFPLNNGSILQTERAIFDQYSLSIEQLNHLWGILGGKYLPSVLYKVRLISVFVDEDTDPAGVIRSLEREEQVIN